jgi:hypothetical protein
MLIIGGVVALAVVIIIEAAVIIDHKKKIEQSPIIFNRGSSGTPVSTLATTGTTTIPATTTAGVTNPATTTAGVTTIPATTTAGVITIPTPTVPIQKKTYIRSTPATGNSYLICEFGKLLSTTPDVTKATPVTFTKCTGPLGNNEYCLMFNNENVKFNPGGMISTDGEYTIYIHSLTETTYIGLLGHTLYFDGAMGFLSNYSLTAPTTVRIWNVVTM